MDISIVNAMMPKYKEKLETAQRRMEEAKAKMEKEKDAAQTATQEVTDLLSWADTFDEANAETKHMIIARLVERIEINHDYEVQIKFRIKIYIPFFRGIICSLYLWLLRLLRSQQVPPRHLRCNTGLLFHRSCNHYQR